MAQLTHGTVPNRQGNHFICAHRIAAFRQFHNHDVCIYRQSFVRPCVWPPGEIVMLQALTVQYLSFEEKNINVFGYCFS